MKIVVIDNDILYRECVVSHLSDDQHNEIAVFGNFNDALKAIDQHDSVLVLSATQCNGEYLKDYYESITSLSEHTHIAVLDSSHDKELRSICTQKGNMYYFYKKYNSIDFITKQLHKLSLVT